MSEPNIIVQSEAQPRLDSNAYTLTVRQQPERAKVFNGVQQKEKGRSHGPGASKTPTPAADPASDRKPVDPPPIIQLQIIDPVDPAQNYLQSPYFFMCCSLADEDARDSASLGEATVPEDPHSSSDGMLSGMLVSSLHRLKDTNNTDGGFFVFPDISVKHEGTYRLRFSLFEMVKDARPHVLFVKSILTDAFKVHSQRNFPGMLESTYLSRSFSDQGVRLRVRKEPRILGKRPAQSSEMPNRPSQESSSRSASRQESSGLQSPLEQSGNFPSTYGESFPSQAINTQYQSYQGYGARDSATENRSPFPPHEYQHFLGYSQGFGTPQDRYSQGAGSYSGQDVRNWPESYSQDQVGRQPQYAIDDPNLQNIYRSSMMMQGSQQMSYPPPVPPERQLSSTGPSTPQYNAGVRQMTGDVTGLMPQNQYGGRGNVEASYNVGLGPEPYQQLPTRTLPPPNHQYGAGSVMSNQPMNQAMSTPQHSNQQSRTPSGSQQGYDPRYHPYQGSPSYR